MVYVVYVFFNLFMSNLVVVVLAGPDISDHNCFCCCCINNILLSERVSILIQFRKQWRFISTCNTTIKMEKA